MKNLNFLSQDKWDLAKSRAVGNDLLMGEYSLASLRFLKNDLIQITSAEGETKHLTISATAFKELTEILKLPKAFLRRFETSFGDEQKNSFIEVMRAKLAETGQSVFLVGNPITMTIEHILNRAAPISTEAFVDFAESLISHQNLNPVDFRVNGIGNLQINLVADNPVEMRIPGFRSEVFKSGISLNLNPKGILVQNYVNRLWCTNGSVGMMDEDKFRLDEIGNEAIAKFMVRLQGMAARAFVPEGFDERITNAMKTTASYMELQKAAAICSTQGTSWKDLQTYLQIDQVTNAYARLGYDMDKVTEAVKRKAHTPFTIWDVFNGMTAWATHNTVLDDRSRSQIAVRAGDFLSKENDLSMDIPNPFGHRIDAPELDRGEN